MIQIRCTLLILPNISIHKLSNTAIIPFFEADKDLH